jgi:large subunit ribosomal protein L9
MKVILLDDIERVGHEGDILAVADGYARNWLIPKKMAVQATKGALKDLERRRTAISAREGEKRTKAQGRAAELGNLSVVIHARAGQGLRLHGQVTPQMIAEAVKTQLGIIIDRRDIDITEPIRELGDYLIRAKVYKDVAAELPVKVLREGGEEEEVAPAPEPEPTPEPPAEAPEEEAAEEEDAA